MNIYGEKTVITGLEETDQPFLNSLINDPSIEHMTAGESFPVSLACQEAWFHAHKGDCDPRRFAIRKIDNNEIVGMIYISQIDLKNQKCGTGIKIGGGYRGKGYARDAVNALLNYLFNELNFNRVEAKILEYNVPSQKLYTKCGFVLEGRLRKTIYKKGLFRDQLVYSILKDEFNRIKE